MSYITICSLIILAICLITGLIKGFVRALLRLISAIGTCMLTVLLTPYLAKQFFSTKFVQEKNLPSAVISGLSAVIILVLCCLVFGIITLIVHKSISKSILSGANRFLGGVLYVCIGFSVLILVGYVINISSGATYMQPVIADSQKDVFANWLVTNNLFNKFLEALAKEGSVFQEFIRGFSSNAG
ncbi:MAG: CvpA family protein [Clostridia bacterium]|nr:CvpA family protein [Clostridia bacterium]MDE7079916.1 CvpA family protein [Clostridia bacterium]